MQVDLILEHPEYRLQSRSRLSARDDEYKRVWMDGREPLYVIFRRIRNLRIAVRKEYYEAAFLLDRIAPELRRARSVYEIAAGHGMFGMFAAAMFRNLERVIHVDLVRPQSYERILEQVALDYPFVKPRSEYHEAPAGEGPPVPAGSLVVGLHCCGALTDSVAECARSGGASFAVVPCCERRSLLRGRDAGARGEDIPRIVNDARVRRWTEWGYAVEERELPDTVTKRRRIFVATAPDRSGTGPRP